MPKLPHKHLLLLAAVGSLLLIIGYHRCQDSWTPPPPVVDLLDYVNTDQDMATACSSILEGDTKEIEKAKRLMLHGDFRKSVRFSNEDYIYATQDCQ